MRAWERRPSMPEALRHGPIYRSAQARMGGAPPLTLKNL
jgi:hypothetical protein